MVRRYRQDTHEREFEKAQRYADVSDKRSSADRSPHMFRLRGVGLARALIFFGVLLCIVAIVLIGLTVYGYWDAQRKYDLLTGSSDFSTELANKVSNNETDLTALGIDWDALKAVNPDIIAWIYVPGTTINYPIVQTHDNEYYLTHNVDRSYSASGAIFLDQANSGFSDAQVLIYGHHMIDGSMFAGLINYKNQDYFNKHRDIVIMTPTRNYLLKTAYVFTCSGDAKIRQISYPSLEDFHLAVTEQYNSAVAYSSDVDLDDVSQVFDFVTCSYETNDTRTILVAIIVDEVEL